MKKGVGIGIPGIYPPKYPNDGSLMIGSSLLLIHAAIERPAVNSISVATIGCILKYATKIPLNAPKSIATTHAKRNATIIGALSILVLSSFLRTLRITLPAIAIAAPTLISCPPEAAVTSVIPIARMASSEP